MDLNLNVNHYSAVAETLTSVENVLSSVQETLKSEPVTEEVYKKLIQQLDLASQNLSALEKTASNINQFALSYFAQLRQKAISLYGEIDDSYLHHEVVVLQDETHVLEESIASQDIKGLAERIGELRQHLIKILNEFSPALPERRALVMAKLVLNKAEAFLRGESSDEIAIDEMSLLEIEEILEEIADYLAEDNRGALRLLMRRLTPSQRNLVIAYLEPKDLLSSLLHDIEGTTNNHVVFLS